MVCEKYVASGNDFLIFHTFRAGNRSALAQRLCDRHSGIGADGLIALLPTRETHCDFVWEFYNRDGSKPAMCGNGSRAAALYAFRHGLCEQELCFLTDAGKIDSKILEGGNIAVQFPFVQILQQDLIECDLPAWLLDTGVPHLVLCANDLNAMQRPTTEQLCALRKQYNANVDVMAVAQNRVFVRTFERGVEAETLACGTGMAACFVVAHKTKLVGNESIVIPASGEELHFFFSGNSLWFSGLVRYVATCQVDDF